MGARRTKRPSSQVQRRRTPWLPTRSQSGCGVPQPACAALRHGGRSDACSRRGGVNFRRQRRHRFLGARPPAGQRNRSRLAHVAARVIPASARRSSTYSRLVPSARKARLPSWIRVPSFVPDPMTCPAWGDTPGVREPYTNRNSPARRKPSHVFRRPTCGPLRCSACPATEGRLSLTSNVRLRFRNAE